MRWRLLLVVAVVGVVFFVAPVAPRELVLNALGGGTFGWLLARWATRPARRTAAAKVAGLEAQVEDMRAQEAFSAGFVSGWNGALTEDYMPKSPEDLGRRCRADFEIYRATAGITTGRAGGA